MQLAHKEAQILDKNKNYLNKTIKLQKAKYKNELDLLDSTISRLSNQIKELKIESDKKQITLTKLRLSAKL